MEKRFIIGVDLGTTNSAVAYIDLENDSPRQIHKFKIPQLIGPGDFSALPVLPSFLYIPGTRDISPEDIIVPWSIKERNREDKNLVGKFARDHGLKVPSRLISSAKSWLCNSSVDRKARILPWGSDENVFKISPVQASASYLKHIRMAWNVARGEDYSLYLENQTVVITVPASFDEIARELTLESASMAGLHDVILLEEPLAAFYNWLYKNKEDWPKYIKPNQLILVCDVGGGTTDFTLIYLKEIDGKHRFERLAVGDHLILGGDNVDVAIANKVISHLKNEVETMSNNVWNNLLYQCRNIKEKILDGELTSARIVITGSGSKLISSTFALDIELEDIEEVVFEEFFPLTGISKNKNKPPIRRGGLSYEDNTSITNHLGNFIKLNQSEIHRLLNTTKICPDFVLFNGGALKPSSIQNRIMSFLENEFYEFREDRLSIINNDNINSAVSFGAAYYGLVKNNRDLMVGSGSSRSFYVGMQGKDSCGYDILTRKAICFVERGLEEGNTVRLPQKQFELLANQPVSIEIYSSSFRSGDNCGDIIDVDDTLTELPPIHTVIQFGDKEITSKIPIIIEAIYTEVGTLEIWCKSILTSHKWRLNFQLRGSKIKSSIDESEIFDSSRIKSACDVVKDTFSHSKNNSLLAGLTKKITKILGRSKNQWPLSVIRSLVDIAIKYVNVREVSSDAESRWLNFVGFCLRPGTGEGFDKYRIKKLWKFYKQGPIHSNSSQVLSEWWIMWRRVAAGLNPGQQRQFFQDVKPILIDDKSRKKSKQEKIEIWMAAANMESLNVEDKIRLGQKLLNEIVRKKTKPQLLWSLSRLGGRNPLYSSLDHVVGYEQVSKWIEKIMMVKWNNYKPVIEMITFMAQKTGDQVIDIIPELRSEIVNWIRSIGTFENHVEKINKIVERSENEQKIVFGDSIPTGIIFKE